MTLGTALTRNLTFWHWYPEMLLQGLSQEQLRWQPEGHDTSILFATWHSYRSCDELVHGLVMRQPSVYTTQGWADRLPPPEGGRTPFGNGMTREQIGALDLDPAALIAYAKAVGEDINRYLASLSDEEAAQEIDLPFFKGVYPGVDRASKLETVAFFAIGHTAEHLGEVQMVKGLLGLQGAPL